jgi:hypothetical protein
MLACSKHDLCCMAAAVPAHYIFFYTAPEGSLKKMSHIS